VPLKDVATLFSRFFFVGFYLPAFFALVAAAGSLPHHWLPDAVDVAHPWYASGHDLGGILLVLAALALPVGLLLSGVWLRTLLLYRLQSGWLARRVPKVWSALTWFAQLRFKRAKADWASSDPRIRSRAATRLQDRYPQQSGVLPSCFGNVVAAYEEYPANRWGLDYTATSRHMATFLNEQERGARENVETQLAFALNLSLSLVLVGVAGAAGAVWGERESVWRATELARFLPLALSYGVYRLLAIPAIVEFGRLARASFDLHRSDLYVRLGARDALSFGDDEKRLGSAVSAYLLYGFLPRTSIGRLTSHRRRDA
jgi:hypothetical protein